MPSTETPDSERTIPPAHIAEGLSGLVGSEHVFTEGPAFGEALHDATGNRGVSGRADALVLPGSTEEVAAVFRYCYEREIPMTVRGGGTGLAAGAVPDGGVVLGLERLDRVRSITPELWRMEAEAGVRTGTIHRVALENGLLFPPDPGASEQSMIGGNIATNAGGPHAFKYGVTGSWVTGIEAVVAPGEILRTGGPVRKNVAALDLTDLMIGSEGTLGIVTAAWLKLAPAPETRGIVVGFYPDAATGCEAISMVMGSGLQPTALEYLDRGALAASIGSFPLAAPREPGFAVVAEADGDPTEVERLTAELAEAMDYGALGPAIRETDRIEIGKFWQWRDGVSIAVAAAKGGKLSEDVVVPGERLAEAVEGVTEIGARHSLEACSWGHAGDGNLHATFLVDLADKEELARASNATGEIFEMAIRLGGSISGEHGIGALKTKYVNAALDPAELRLQAELKNLFDPKNLLNPGKKIPGS